jgi:hypothetical protein
MITAMEDWDLDPPSKKSDPPAKDGAALEPARPAPPPACTSRLEPAPASEPGSDSPPTSGSVRLAGAQKWSRRLRSGLPWIVVALVALVIGLAIGLLIARSQASDDAAALAQTRTQLGELQQALTQSEDRNWTYYRNNEALKAELEQTLSGGQDSTSTTVPGPSGASGTYRDGVYLVGDDISPGTYDGVITGDLGYWARLKGTDGSVSAIIANAIPRGSFVLTIYPSDQAVELRGVEIHAR